MLKVNTMLRVLAIGVWFFMAPSHAMSIWGFLGFRDQGLGVEHSSSAVLEDDGEQPKRSSPLPNPTVTIWTIETADLTTISPESYWRDWAKKRKDLRRE